MNIVKTEGIIIKSQDYTETSKIVKLFTKTRGKISLLAKGAHRKKSIFTGKLDLFCAGEFIYYQSRKSELDTLMECDIDFFFSGLRKDMTKFIYGSYILELLDTLFTLEEENKKIFNLSLQTLHYLNTEKLEKIKQIIRFFEIRFLDTLGFLPDFTCCSECGKSSQNEYWLYLEKAMLLCEKCHQNQLKSPAKATSSAFFKKTGQRNLNSNNRPKTSKDFLKLISSALQKDFPSLLRIKLSEQQQNQLEDILRIFLDFSLEKQLKSLVFLERIKEPFK